MLYHQGGQVVGEVTAFKKATDLRAKSSEQFQLLNIRKQRRFLGKIGTERVRIEHGQKDGQYDLLKWSLNFLKLFQFSGETNLLSISVAVTVFAKS